MDIEKTANQLKMMILTGMLILVGQKIGFGLSVAEAIPGVVLIIIIASAKMMGATTNGAQRSSPLPGNGRSSKPGAKSLLCLLKKAISILRRF